MIPLFLGLTLANILTLCVTGTLGYLGTTSAPARSWHTLAGALATLVACGVHCVVFTYFIATAKWVQHAVATRNLDPGFTTPTRSFRRQAFPAALLAMAITFAAAILGAAHDNFMVSRNVHHATAVAAFVVNVLVAIIEYNAIARNGRLIDSVLAAVAEQQQRSGVASPEAQII